MIVTVQPLGPTSYDVRRVVFEHAQRGLTLTPEKARELLLSLRGGVDAVSTEVPDAPNDVPARTALPTMPAEARA